MRKIKKYLHFIKGQLLTYWPNETRRLNKGNEFVLVLASAHKVGSTWSYKMISDLKIFRQWIVPHTFRANIRNKGLLDLHKNNVDSYLKKFKHYRLFKSHSLPPSWHSTCNVKFLTVFRDPRDVVISNIFYLANLDSRLGGWPDLIDMPLKDRIAAYLNKGIYDLQLMEKWFLYNDCHKIFYEEMLEDPDGVMKKVFEDMNLIVSSDERCRVVSKNDFKKLSKGRKTGQADTKSFFRKGVAGDWKNYFGEEEKDLFKTQCNGRWNKLLLDLGYEKDENW